MDYADYVDGKRNDTRNESSSIRTGRMIAMTMSEEPRGSASGIGYAGLAE